MESVDFDGKKIELDHNGHLLNRIDWNSDVAIELARRNEIELVEDHWYAINFARDYYETYKIAPSMRVLSRSMKENYGESKVTNGYLYDLFPGGYPAKMVAMLAGLPRPTGCF